MKPIEQASFDALIKGAVLMTEDAYGPKVYRLESGDYLKLFRLKRLMSLASLYPYALRFKFNAEKLASLGIKTITCKGVYSIPHIKRSAVLYSPLEGELLREIAPQVFPREAFAKFYAGLHDQGIYFRSCHLGNILQTGPKEFGLIDVADMRFYRHALDWRKRLRNFKHLLRYQLDEQLLDLSDKSDFWLNYFLNAKLSLVVQKRLQQQVVGRR